MSGRCSTTSEVGLSGSSLGKCRVEKSKRVRQPFSGEAARERSQEVENASPSCLSKERQRLLGLRERRFLCRDVHVRD